MSCSQVIAIPPCICTASAATFENASLAATRASAADVWDGSAIASLTTARADCTATYRSAIRCLSAWKLPIGRPNCTRSLVYSTVRSRHFVAAPICSAANRIAALPASPGSAPMSAESLTSTRASRRVRSIVSTRCAVKVVPRASRGDDDVGDVAVDHIAGVEHDRSDRGALGQPLDRLGVGLVGGEQGEFGECGAEQRRRHQRLAELLDHHGSVGEIAAGAAQLLWHHQGGRADLFAQQLPQRFVVAAFGGHRLTHRGGRRVLVDQRGDGLAQQLPFFTHNASKSLRRCTVASPHADRRACTRSSHRERSCSWVNPIAPCVCSADRAASSAASDAAALAALTSRAVSDALSARDNAAPYTNGRANSIAMCTSASLCLMA